MNSFLCALLLLVGPGAPGAVVPEDGFYLRGQGKSLPKIQSQDGRTVSLGPRRELKLRGSSLVSQDNANTRFHLNLTIPHDETLGSSTYVLVVDGTAYRQTGSGSSGKETSSLSFYVSNNKNAKQVSIHFNTPVVYRRHPGHHLRVSFTPTRPHFQPGDDVTATLRITNVGKHPVAFMQGGRNRAARDNQYTFTAYHAGKQIEDIGTTFHFGGIATRRVLKPGDTFENTISLSKWFEFHKAGMYQVHGSYFMEFSDPQRNSWRTIWEDYVSADFMVNLQDPNQVKKKAGAGEVP
ncbi:MAG: hypothetical protein OER86_14465 [Phycisphaerae bacterium]|nr:hypothetical protein [Phycisphaerae bacterium]